MFCINSTLSHWDSAIAFDWISYSAFTFPFFPFFFSPFFFGRSFLVWAA
jgi:hypothetical protein